MVGSAPSGGGPGRRGVRSASRHGAWSRIKGSDHSLPGTTAVNVASAGTGAFDAELVILGTSTWGCVDSQDDWAATGFVQLEAADWKAPVGLFGYFGEVTLVYPSPLEPGLRVLAQDLAGDTPVDVTDRVKISGNRLSVPGGVIREVGLMASTEGDLSAPGLVLKMECGSLARKKAMGKPGGLCLFRPCPHCLLCDVRML